MPRRRSSRALARREPSRAVARREPSRAPAPTRRRRRRVRARRSNPGFEQALAAILVAGTIGAITIFVVRYVRNRRRYAGLPVPPEGALPGLPPLTSPSPPASGVVGDLCENAARYPGFVWDGTLCVPGPTTPPGVYVTPDCGDFVFKDGEGGAQGDYLAALLAQTETASRWNDPTDLVTSYLTAFWPECAWPPAASSPARVVQLYMALSFLIGREILIASRAESSSRKRGRVLGQTDATAADEAVATRLAELGLPSFDPSVVPEIELPEVPIVTTPGVTGLPGQPTPGIIQLPPEPPPPPQPGIIQLPTPECMTTPHEKTGHEVLSETSWISKKTRTFEVANIDPEPECHVFELLIGLCLRTRPGASYGLLDYAVAGWPPKGVDKYFKPIPSLPEGWTGVENFQINGWAPAVDLQKFKLPGTLKLGYRAKVTITAEDTIVSDVQKINGDWDLIDACVDKQARWIDKDLTIVGADGITRPWDLPTVEIMPQGKRIKVAFTYVGLPVFVDVDGVGRAVFPPENGYDLYYKTRWIGLGN